MDRNELPTLTEAVGKQEIVAEECATTSPISAEELIELRAEIVSGCLSLVEELMEDSFREIEAILADKLAARLQILLPELVDEALAKRLSQNSPD